MKKFVIIVVAIVTPFFVTGCTTNQHEFLTHADVHERAESFAIVNLTLGELGINRAGTHERLISDRWIGYLCLRHRLHTPKGPINTAMCVPDWYKRAFPAHTVITFVYQADITKRAPLMRALYMETSNFRRHKRFGRLF